MQKKEDFIFQNNQQGHLSRCLHEQLANLPDKYRIAIVMHHLENKSHAFAAQELGCSTTLFATRLSRAREMLRKWEAKDSDVPSPPGGSSVQFLQNGLELRGQ